MANSNYFDGDSQYVTLWSNQSLEYFPDNISTNFSNFLSVPFSVPTDCYEVAISEIIFEEKDKPTVAHPADKPSYFGLPMENNLITVKRFPGMIMNFTKKSIDFNLWRIGLQERINQLFNSTELGVKMSFFYEGKPDPKTTLTIIDTSSKFTMRIEPAYYAKILGFNNKTEFKSGIFRSEELQSRDEFNKVPLEDRLTIYLTAVETELLEVEEPDEYLLELLISNCAEVLLEKGVKVKMPYDPKSSKLILELEYPGYSIQLPRVVNDELGLDPDFVFKDKRTVVQVDQMRTRMLEKKTGYYPSNQVLIHSNIVDSKYYGVGEQAMEGSSNILRIFPRKLIKAPQHYIFEPLYFHPLKYTHFQTINIQLTGEKLKPITATATPTFVVLKFQRKL